MATQPTWTNNTQSFSRGKHSGWKENILRAAPMFLAPFGAAGLDSLVTPGLSFLGGYGGGSVGTQALNAAAAPAGTAASGSGAVSGVAGSGGSAAAGGGSAAGAGGTAAATGPKWLKYLDDIRSGVSDLAGARANNQAVDAFYDSQNQRAEFDRADFELDRANTELNQRRYLDDYYDTNVRRATRGGLLRGTQDVNVQAPAGIPMGTVTGGLRPSAIAGKDELGSTVQARAMQELLNPPSMDGQSSGAGYAPPPAFSSDMSADQAWQAAQGYFTQRGKTPLPTSEQSWKSYWNQWGQKDPKYFGDRLSVADEFTGGPRNLSALPATPRSSAIRPRRSGVDTALGIGSAVLPFVSSMLGDYGKRSKTTVGLPDPMLDGRYSSMGIY